jgi:uncharacterized protein YuzE
MDAAPIRRNDKRGVVLVDLDEGVEVATVECVREEAVECLRCAGRAVGRRR